MGKTFTFIVIGSFLLVAFASTRQAKSPTFVIPYPEGFRQWAHIKTTLTGLGNIPQAKFDGYHHIYANDKAIDGYKSGIFPDGSIIVFDKHEIDTTGGSIQSGKRKFINVMQKNAEAFKETGGWGYEEFSGNSRTDGRLSPARQQSCYTSCHQSKKMNDYVFSKVSD